MQRLIRGAAIKKLKEILTECKDSAKELAVDKWNLGNIKDLTMEPFWTWDKEYQINNDGDAYLVLDK